MNPAMLQFALTALQTLPALLDMGAKVASVSAFAKQQNELLNEMVRLGRGPSTEEWAAQNETIRKLREELHS